MAIIAILAALTLGAAGPAMAKASRSRAASEIQGMCNALERYKTDKGIYPTGDPGLTVPYSGNPGAYQVSSEALFQALSGIINYATDPPVGTAYMTFKANQIGSPTANSYIKDPWNNSYGYSTGNPYNGTNFFDLWSTGGTTTGLTNGWISNWQ